MIETQEPVEQKRYAICTLFEKDYHFGLAVLINSLIAHGFKGKIWAGYRGKLPEWIEKIKNEKREQEDYYIARLNDQVALYLVELYTDKHLTNYKPDFMLDILDMYDSECSALYYFDPDIVIKNNWKIFEDWIKWGVLLSEDLNSPLNRYHPLRKLWMDCYRKYEVELESTKDSYVNGGFVGLKRSDKSFLSHWKKIQDIMAIEIGSLKEWGLKDRSYLFSMTDQDALNISIMNETPVTILGKDAMDIIPGGYIMSHAIGPHKPWRNHYIKHAFKGIAPSYTDKLFWKYSDGQLKPYSFVSIAWKRASVLIASIISRFIRR